MQPEARAKVKKVQEQWIELACRRYPELKEMSNRIYDLPGCAASYRGLLAVISAGVLGVDGTQTENHTNAVNVSRITNHPWWYIPKPVVELLQDIELKGDDLFVDETAFTHPGMWFLLPRGVLTGDAGEDIHWLNVTLITDAVKQAAAARAGVQAGNLNGKTALQCSAWSEDGVMFHSSVEIHGGKITKEHLESLELQTDPTLATNDVHWPSKVLLPLCLNLVTLMHAKPELVEVQDKKTGTIKKTGRTTWLPRCVGRHYTRRYVQPGSNRSVTLHKRRAHWKHVPHGPGRTLRRYTLIDETWVGTDAIA